MAKHENIWDMEANELVTHYVKKTLSPVEATEAILGHIEKHEPKINAFALLDKTSAIEDARKSEARWMKGAPLGPVDGVPAAIKDLILTKGWPTLWGSRSTDPNQEWNEDSPATARLRESGAVLLGKSTTAEFGWKGLSDCPVHGVTRNPWNLEHTAGGSSGGSSAGAAAGFGPLHVATDGGGSGRMPASHTGVVGFKPTLGRVAVYPYSQNGTLYNVTPMARSVRDVALLFDVVAKPDPRDWNSLPPTDTVWRDGLENGVAGLKIAFSPALGYADVHPDVAAAVAAAVKVFSELGAHVEQVDPGIEDPMPTFRTFWATGAARRLDALGDKQKLVELGLQDVAAEGRTLDAVTFASAVERREVLGRHFLHFHQKWDLLITPMIAQPPSKIVEDSVGLGKQTPLPAFTYLSPFAYPFNLTQQPAITVPCAFTKDGLPVGLQIVAAKYHDAKVLNAARAFEKARPFKVWNAN
ncbi:amidase [Pseudaminobacter sp. NGMCC 1.201702]|uniref:amidase n=1 Tax=Pseudaminobacter sp. NGMCC 1.201702 TaxID=3391825 RepID=UPI0039EF6BFF